MSSAYFSRHFSWLHVFIWHFGAADLFQSYFFGCNGANNLDFHMLTKNLLLCLVSVAYFYSKPKKKNKPKHIEFNVIFIELLCLTIWTLTLLFLALNFCVRFCIRFFEVFYFGLDGNPLLVGKIVSLQWFDPNVIHFVRH